MGLIPKAYPLSTLSLPVDNWGPNFSGQIFNLAREHVEPHIKRIKMSWWWGVVRRGRWWMNKLSEKERKEVLRLNVYLNINEDKFEFSFECKG